MLESELGDRNGGGYVSSPTDFGGTCMYGLDHLTYVLAMCDEDFWTEEIFYEGINVYYVKRTLTPCLPWR